MTADALRPVYSDTTQLNSTSSWVELRRYKRAFSFPLIREHLFASSWAVFSSTNDDWWTAMVTIVLYQVIYFDVIVFIGRINMLNRQQLALLSSVHTGDKVEFNTRSTLLKVNKIDRVALAPYILATKSTELATMSTATSCRIQAVADLPPKPATKSTNRRQSTLLPICRRFRQQSTLSPVCTGL